MLVEILKKDKPLNVTLVEEHNKPKLVVMFALPHLLEKIEAFAKDLLDNPQPQQ